MSVARVLMRLSKPAPRPNNRLNEELLARLNRSGRAWAVPHRAAGGELLLLQPTPALADGAESWAQVSTSKSRGYHGLETLARYTLPRCWAPAPQTSVRCVFYWALT